MRSYPNAGETIRIQMVRCGYTKETLSEKTGISEQVLRGILTGRVEAISTRNVYAMSKAFGFQSADFIDLLSGVLPPEKL